MNELKCSVSMMVGSEMYLFWKTKAKQLLHNKGH